MLEFGKWLKDPTEHYHYVLYEKSEVHLVGLLWVPDQNILKLTYFITDSQAWDNVSAARPPQLPHLITSQKIGVIEKMFKLKWGP